MKFVGAKRIKLSEKIGSYVGSPTPLRDFVGNWSKIARYAIAEANSLSLEKISIKIKRLPKKLDGFRLIHLSDIHHSPFTNLEHIIRAVKVSNRLKPDMFVLTGDYVSHETSYITPVAKVLGELKSEFGTFACLGNHDHWTDPEMITASFRANGMTVLINEGLRFQAHGASFWLAGVDDHLVGKTDLPSAVRGSYADEMKLLLAHNPIIFRQAVKEKIDLVLSGHTHGGQVKFRDQVKRILPRRKLTNGLHERKDTQIYITRGIGTVVLPIRYQCPPEISLIELKCG